MRRGGIGRYDLDLDFVYGMGKNQERHGELEREGGEMKKRECRIIST